MREKKDLILDVLTGIDEVLLQKNLEQRYTLWQKPKRRRSPLIISLISAAACILLLVTGLFAFMRTPDDVPVYHGMTISKEDETKPSDTAQTAGISGTTALRSPFLYAPKKAVFPARMIYGGPEDKKPDKDLPVFGQNYYAMPGEDIYINIHLSNPGGYEILSFTLNGVKYSSYMFEPGSDLETLILKTNVGETGGLKEYTIDAIKYVDGERIKDVKMKGDRTVKVFVNDDSGFLQLETEIDGLTLNVRTLWADTFTGEKKLLSLALYEDDVLYKELAPDASFVNGLPLGKRFVLRAEYLDQGMPQTVNHVFTMPKESEGLVISNGLITGIGTCSDTVLYLDHPIAEKFLQDNLHVQKVYMTENVTSIGQMAFSGCKTLKTAVLPNHLTEIPDSLFSGCINLSSVSLPEKSEHIGDGAFSGCLKLSNLSLPEGLVSIGHSAFDRCSFTAVVLPQGITSIGNFAFQSCTSLTSITIPKGIKSIGDYAFANCVKLVEVINHSALSIKKGPHSDSFIGNNALEVHNGATRIVNKDGYLFYTYNGVNYLIGYTGSQTDLTLPENYNGEKYRIHNYAFHECSELTSITLPKGVTSIGEYAFNGCTKLKSITISEGITEIGDLAFSYCRALTSITIPDSINSIGGSAFTYCSSLASVTLPNGVTSIGNHAFSYCESLEKIAIPSNLKRIENGVFFACKSLTSITIPNGITSIGNGVFSYSGLTDVTIPNSVKRVGEEAFSYCDELTTIYVIYCDTTSLPADWDTNWASNCTAKIVVSGQHSWEKATCKKPKTCSVCGLTQGSATDDHVWNEATCGKPKTCSVCGLTEGSATGNHVWDEATCGKPRTCTVCGLKKSNPHVLNEKSVCTLCGRSAADIRQEVIKNAPKTSISLYNPIVEIWENHLHLLITAPYKGKLTGNFEPTEKFQFDLYYAPKGSNDYALTSLQPWSLYSFGDTAIYRLQFYDLLYPHLKVGTEYDVTIVMTQDNEIVGWSNVTLLWSQTMDDTVKQAERKGIVSCNHVWENATCEKPKTCTVCGLTQGSATGNHVWEEATCQKPKTCSVCGLTEGSATGNHVWDEATCEKPRTCTVCGLTEGSATGNHVWEEATCEKAKHCSVCGLEEGIKKPHVLNEKSVCTLCGHSYNAKDVRQEILEITPQENVYFGTPVVEIWEGHLQMLIIAPYSGEVTGNGEPPKDLTFDLYYAPCGSNDYLLTSLQPWSLYSFGDTAIYRLQFYDLLYPHLTVGTEYDVTIVIRRGNEIVGWNCVALLWSKTLDDTVKQAVREDILSCDHIWQDATCKKPMTCSVCGLEKGVKNPHVLNEESVCTLCGHKYSVADSRQDVISTAPKINMYFFSSAVEIWSNHLQLLITAPYEGETTGSYDPLEGLTFDLYHAPQGSNDYTLTSLQPWSLAYLASSAVYRIHFYDLLYPHFTVGTKYDVTVVMKQDDEVVGYAELSLSWTQKLEDLVVTAINDPGITK